MAKDLSDQRHRFVFHIAVDDPDQVGHVQIQLHEQGYTIIGCDLVTDVLAYKKNEKLWPGGLSPGARIREIVEGSQDAAISAAAIKDIFRSEDRAIGSVHTALDNMVKHGKLQKTGPGVYQKLGGLLTHEHAAAEKLPKVRAAQRLNGHEAPASRPHHTYDIPNYMLIYDFIKNLKTFKVSDLRDHFRNENRNQKSVGGILTVFKAKGLIEAKGPGEYQPLKQNLTAYIKDKESSAHG